MKLSNSQFFLAQEFLPPLQYKNILRLPEDKREAAFYKLVNPKIVKLANFFREYFDAPVIINNWHSGGTYTLRGWRPKESKIGAKNSQHKIGCAFDCDVKGKSAEEVRKIIQENQPLFYAKGLRRNENLVSWVHNDIKETGQTDKIILFNP